MKVWVEFNYHGNEVEGVHLAPGRPRSHAFEVVGTEGKVLVDRKHLSACLVTPMYAEGIWGCRWMGCDHQSRGDGKGGVEVLEPHSDTCPLAISEPDEPRSPPGGAD